MKRADILYKVKNVLKKNAPNAKAILFGSFARGENTIDSDLDILILLDKDEVTREDEIRIKYPLYDIEFDTGQIISPLVLSQTDWENKHRITPFYENVLKDGIAL